MKRLLIKYLLWIFLIGYQQLSFSQTPTVSIEAEIGVREGGVAVATTVSGYSGTGYVTNFTTSADKLTVTMNVPSKGFYKLTIRYQSEYKEQYLFVNGRGPSNVVFPATTAFTEIEAGKYLLNAGNNTFTIQKSWGWINIDKFSLYSVAKNTYNITPDLINSAATDEAKDLYAFLRSKFNKNIISGQTSDYFDKIKPISGKTPMLRAFDFQAYTQGYAWKWDNSTQKHTFGWEDTGVTQSALDWYSQTSGLGIVSFQWHWHSPTGGSAGSNTFYTDKTSFDVTKAVQPGTVENTYIIRDIDSIATQLKKLSAAGIPVLWRPLHEAGGAWFWWGAKGPSACRKLYGIVYDRLTNYHGLNNLIWVWSTPETDWYPGNDSVDIVGYDSYPGAYNYDPQKAAFDRLYNLVNGEKLIAMSENGPIPDPDECLEYDAPWSYFMSWSDLVTQQNTNQHISEVYNNFNVITMENPTSTGELINKENSYRVFPNPAREVIYIKGNEIKNLELLDISGKSIYVDSNSSGIIPTADLADGVYILRISDPIKTFQSKVVVQK